MNQRISMRKYHESKYLPKWICLPQNGASFYNVYESLYDLYGEYWAAAWGYSDFMYRSGGEDALEYSEKWAARNQASYPDLPEMVLAYVWMLENEKMQPEKNRRNDEYYAAWDDPTPPNVPLYEKPSDVVPDVEKFLEEHYEALEQR